MNPYRTFEQAERISLVDPYHEPIEAVVSINRDWEKAKARKEAADHELAVRRVNSLLCSWCERSLPSRIMSDIDGQRVIAEWAGDCVCNGVPNEEHVRVIAAIALAKRRARG